MATVPRCPPLPPDLSAVRVQIMKDSDNGGRALTTGIVATKNFLRFWGGLFDTGFMIS